MELSGSVARGTADQWSDLDLKIITTPEGFESFLSDWQSWLERITPTVFARRPIAPFIVNTLTPDGLTLDLAIYSGQAPAEPTGPARYPVGLLSSRKFDDLGDALEYAVEEELRGLAGPFITLIQREEHMRHLTGVPHILGLLATVFLAETGSRPRPSNGTGLQRTAARHSGRARLRYQPPEMACSPSVSPWPNCWSSEPGLSTSAMTDVGRGSSLRWPEIDLKESSDSTSVIGCTSRTARAEPRC